jgi:hypothetical protein
VALVGAVEIGKQDGGQFGAPQGAGEADQQQRAVPNPRRSSRIGASSSRSTASVVARFFCGLGA